MSEIAKPALDVVMNDEVKFHPEKIQKYVQTLDGKHPRLEYFSSIVVGPTKFQRIITEKEVRIM